MLNINGIEKSLYSVNKEKQTVYALPLGLFVLTIICVVLKGLTPVGLFLLVGAYGLYHAYRFQWIGALTSAITWLAMLLGVWKHAPQGSMFFLTFLSLAMGVNSFLMALLAQQNRREKEATNRQMSELKQEKILWQTRFEAMQNQCDTEKDMHIKERQVWTEKEEELNNSLESMEKLLSILQHENEELIKKNGQLAGEVDSHMQTIAYLKTAKDPKPLEKKIQKLQKQLNESRVQHYQDQILYAHWKEKAQEDKIQEKELSFKSENQKTSDELETDNIYLNLHL